ncbi:E3 ubiquitin-protein ligase TRIM39-like [Pristis pectinata]|uniref:E3 ubiquitin-protein ligase TRIM39-like n=1 Tax=Pristis pectinata TaxID=685728 RepID=UPI00223CA187|nr:E3 ubiquitin-protein ligase TRIM39-like [Pristis pectinata]
MASGKLIGGLCQELICPICLELFTDPVSLECEHYFCGSCISQVWEKVLGDVSCPQCQQVFTQRHTRPSRTLGNIAEQVRLLSAKARQREEEFFCREHDEKLKLFCEDELEVICVECWNSAHQKHNVLPINAAVEKYKDKLEAVLASLQRKMERLTKRKMKGEAMMGEPKVWVEELTDEIRAEFEKMHRFLNEQEEALRRQMKEDEEKALKKLEEKLKEIEEEMSMTEGKISEIQTHLKISDDTKMIKVASNMGLRCDVREVRVVEEELSKQTFTEPFQTFRVWKAMRRIIEPVPEYLTLDPETANRQLTLSQDLVSVKQREEEQDDGEEALDPPARFDEYLCVLSSQGFTSGRHYWEVDLGHKVRWVVGVCRESANRKGALTIIPSHGYWVIGLFEDNDYRASTCQDTVIPVDRKPWKLGVYLDYEGGRVSFYDADEMSHLYTFTDTFNEKIYPIFNPCNNLTGRNNEPLILFSG